MSIIIARVYIDQLILKVKCLYTTSAANFVWLVDLVQSIAVGMRGLAVLPVKLGKG